MAKRKECIFSIYDPCYGTGGKLTVAKDYLTSKSHRDMKISLYVFASMISITEFEMGKINDF